MGLFNFFKSKKEQKEQEEQIRIFNAEATIQAFFTEKERKAIVNECKDVIDHLLNECEVKKKTELLECGLEWCNELLEKVNRNPNSNKINNCMIAFTYFRYYFQCVLALDTDIIDITQFYEMYKVSQYIPGDVHKYLQTMIKIYFEIDKGMELLCVNGKQNNVNYFELVYQTIGRYIDSYEDDNTDWNKI